MCLSLTALARRTAALAAMSVMVACAGETGPIEDVWSMTAENNCRTISAGWGAPLDVAAEQAGTRFEPVAVDRLGGAPSFLFLHDCEGASLNGEPVGAYTFAALYVYSKPAGEIAEPFALERGNGQVLAFAAGDPENPILKAFARHGVTVYPADVQWTDELVEDKLNVAGEIKFENGVVNLNGELWANEDGDEFDGNYDVAGNADARIARFHGAEFLARREPRFVTVATEGETPLSNNKLPELHYQFLRGYGQGIVSEVTLMSDRAPKS